MNWSDERYVRLYVRDTVTWKRWTWEARAVFGLLLRRVDRSGVLDAGGGDKVEALSLMLEIPGDVAERVLAQWLASGTVTDNGRALVLPSFIEAQEATQSDRQRQSESRAKRRAAAMTSQTIETTDAPVTPSHKVSQDVTPAVPYRTEPAVTTLSGKPDVLAESESTKPIDLESKLSENEFQVFEHWRVTLNHPKAKPTPERKRLIAKALKAYTVQDLQAAVDGVRKSPHHMGQNDRRTVYDDLELILRDAKHIEGFMKLAGAA